MRLRQDKISDRVRSRNLNRISNWKGWEHYASLSYKYPNLLTGTDLLIIFLLITIWLV